MVRGDLGESVGPLKQEIVLPEIRLITQSERDSLREMANTVCTKVFGPDWDKNGKQQGG